MEPAEDTMLPAVRLRQDEWVEIAAKSFDNSWTTAPFVLRPGADDGQVRLCEDWGMPGKSVRISDLREALDKIEEMSR